MRELSGEELEVVHGGRLDASRASAGVSMILLGAFIVNAAGIALAPASAGLSIVGAAALTSALVGGWTLGSAWGKR